MLGTALWVQGRVAEAARIFDDAVDAARMLDNFQGLAWQLFNRSFAASMAGDVELALATATESVETREASGRQPHLRPRRVGARHAAARDRPGEGGGRSAARVDRWGGAAADPRRLAGIRSRAADPLLARGRPAHGGRGEPRRRRQPARRPSACRWRPRSQPVPRLRSRSQAAMRRARPAQALASAVALEDAGCVLDAAVSRALAGRALAQAGERELAAAELERGGRRLPGVRLRAPPSRSRARAAQARAPLPPWHSARARRTRSACSR